MLFVVRKNNKKPGLLQQIWNSPEFKKKCKHAKASQASVMGGSLHTGGSMNLQPTNEKWLDFTGASTNGVKDNLLQRIFRYSICRLLRTGGKGIGKPYFRTTFGVILQSATNEILVVVNQGWNKICQGGWRDQDSDCFDWETYWRRGDDDNARYVHTYDSPKSKDDSESFRTEDLFDRILNKVKGSDEVLKEMKADFSSLY
ncbi:hypothetical protein MTR67_033945 [Solanum verrucosum]|uniref:Uncharacterized protein n=1 Tax=Solanum verrucosum TaxID=315347 RepID=A0AAF0U7B4_SOLVR|nr:hypothetical protein MTR67_033945 [Solanum verrucosum]